MIIGCYVLDLYCDAPSCPHFYNKTRNPAEYTDESGATCRNQAQQAGWKLDENHTLCPDCHRREREGKENE